MTASIDIETTPDGWLYSIAEWYRQYGKTSALDALREALRADRPPLERLFLMLADEGLIQPITHVNQRMFDLLPYQVKLMEAMRKEARESGWVHFGTPTGSDCYAREATMYHEQGRSIEGTVTGRFTNHMPHFEELPRPWLDDYMTDTADAFSTLLVPQRINVDEFTKEVARITTPKNKPWYQKFDKKKGRY